MRKSGLECVQTNYKPKITNEYSIYTKLRHKKLKIYFSVFYFVYIIVNNPVVKIHHRLIGKSDYFYKQIFMYTDFM